MTQAAKHIKCNHSHHRTGFMVNDRQDPTRTLTLRNRYAREMKKRFRWLRGIIRDAVVEKDVFGIAASENRGIQDNQLQVYAESGLGRQAFDFPRQGQKVSAFMEWLQGQVDRGILEVRDRNRVGDSIDQTWQNMFLEDTYKRGIIRGNYELRQGGFPGVQTLDARGGINAVMGLPMHVDRLGVLYTRAFNDLKGITDAMDTQISRVLVQGLADGDGPRLIARKLSATVGGTSTQGLGITDTLGRFIPAERRAEILARTEIIRAHHHGMMQEYRTWGLEGVQIQAEFRTAGDNRVCEQCEAEEMKGPISLDEAQNLIPVHPMCRCIALPFRPGVDTPSRPQEVRDDWVISADAEDLANQFTSNSVQYGMHSGKIAENIQKELDSHRISKTRLNHVGETIQNDILNKFPEIRRRALAQERGLEFELVDQSRIGAGVDGTQWGNSIRLTRNQYAKTQDSLSLGEYFVESSFKGTVRHEYAHYIEGRLFTDGERSSWETLFQRQGGAQSSFWKDGVSRYGASNAAEAWAESFSAYSHPDYRMGALPSVVESFIQRIVGGH